MPHTHGTPVFVIDADGVGDFERDLHIHEMAMGAGYAMGTPAPYMAASARSFGAMLEGEVGESFEEFGSAWGAAVQDPGWWLFATTAVLGGMSARTPSPARPPPKLTLVRGGGGMPGGGVGGVRATGSTPPYFQHGNTALAVRPQAASNPVSMARPELVWSNPAPVVTPMVVRPPLMAPAYFVAPMAMTTTGTTPLFGPWAVPAPEPAAIPEAKSDTVQACTLQPAPRRGGNVGLSAMSHWAADNVPPNRFPGQDVDLYRNMPGGGRVRLKGFDAVTAHEDVLWEVKVWRFAEYTPSQQRFYYRGLKAELLADQAYATSCEMPFVVLLGSRMLTHQLRQDPDTSHLDVRQIPNWSQGDDY